MILMATWETALGPSQVYALVIHYQLLTTFSVSTLGLINGGTAGLIWIFFVAWIGSLFINISMAEMGSM